MRSPAAQLRALCPLTHRVPSADALAHARASTPAASTADTLRLDRCSLLGRIFDLDCGGAGGSSIAGLKRLLPTILALSLLALAPPRPGRAPSDPYCTGTYGNAAPRAGGPLRFGIDPGLAGSAGGVQLPSTPDDPAKDFAGRQGARSRRGRQLVVRLNRLFWSDGQQGINAFKALVTRYSRAGFDVELQVRYHPASGEAGDIPAWLRYVRHVVDTFGPNRHVISMTITNEVNLTFSPNTSDGSYAGAEDALIQGIEAAHAEAVRRRFKQLRFGFTYAYRFSPQGDASFFSYLGAHGGRSLRAALGFVGLDFYPGTVYPPAMAPGRHLHRRARPGRRRRAQLLRADGRDRAAHRRSGSRRTESRREY